MTLTDRRARPAVAGDHGGASGRRRLRLGPLAAVATVLALVAAGVVVFASPLLGVRHVVVEGASGAAQESQVRAAAAIVEGTPLARLDLVEAERRVGGVDSVAAVHLERDWPDTVVVTVTGRVSVATVSADGAWWSVDADGAVFDRQPERPEGMVELRLATPGEGDRATAAALAVLASLSDEVVALVDAVSAPTEYDVSLELTDGRTVLWGEDRDAEGKNAALPALLAQPGEDFDVTDPTLVTVR